MRVVHIYSREKEFYLVSHGHQRCLFGSVFDIINFNRKRTNRDEFRDKRLGEQTDPKPVLVIVLAYKVYTVS